eukprot:6214837-Pleurochrysis_carterae.AAC.16
MRPPSLAHLLPRTRPAPIPVGHSGSNAVIPARPEKQMCEDARNIAKRREPYSDEQTVEVNCARSGKQQRTVQLPVAGHVDEIPQSIVKLE